MGLTAERGAQTEREAATQHHCEITAESLALKHHSPGEQKDKDRERERGEGKGEAEEAYM